MSRDRFWIAYELDRETMTADRVYRYDKGLMERKDTDGTWFKEPGQCCIFIGEEMDFEDITEEEADQIIVKI